MEEKRLVEVSNRSGGAVSYVIPEMNLRRIYTIGETKRNIPFDEIRQLQSVPGGDYMLKHLLIVRDQKVLEALDIQTEPEYFYTEEEIRKVLLDGTLDQLEDTLNFGTDGVIDLVKKIAVEIELPDMRKRKMIADKTGFFVDTAITINQVMDEEPAEEEKATETKRKAAPINADSASGRKAPLPEYNIVKEG